MISLGRRIVAITILFLSLAPFLDHPATASPIALNWVNATVRLENQWGKGGTGFLIIRKMNEKQGKVFLVTNKHVLHPDPEMRRDAVSLRIYLNIREKDGSVRGTSFQFLLKEEGHRLWREHPHPDVDVMAVDVTSMINTNPAIENQGADYSFFALPEILKSEEITEGDEVLIIGYPLGLYHSRTHSPLVRQGIIATKIGERILIRIRQSSGESRRMEIPGFLIDAAIVPGSSGSPVVLKPIVGRKVRDQILIETTKPYLLGIVSATETAAIRLENDMFPTLAGLGIVFDVETIRETIDLFSQRIRTMEIPNFKDILLAKRQIRPYLLRTPLHGYPAINELIGTEVLIKHENHQPVGAFKIRGGINLISRLTPEERSRGVISASTGNHGQSVAMAARLFGVTARIVVPEKANPGKVASMRGLGAEVLFHGPTFDAARVYCETLAAEKGYRYIHSGDEPLLISGVATETLEMLEDEPDLQAIIVPIGGGSGAAGACIAARGVNPEIRVIGVQSEASPAAFESWRKGRPVECPNQTFAEGLATGTAFALPQAILCELLKDFVLVTDEEILQAMVWMIEKAHTLAEAAGAALAAAFRLRQEMKGKKIGIVCSGGNTSLDHLRKALTLKGDK